MGAEFVVFLLLLVNGMFGSVLLGLLILTAHLGICIHIYLYLGLPQIVQQVHILFPRVGFLKPNQKSLFLICFLVLICSQKTASSICIILVA